MRVLVTGAAGFIGSHLVRALLDRGDEVSAIDNLSTGLERRLEAMTGRGVHVVIGDVRDPAALDRAVDGCDAVLHEAAIPAVARSLLDPALTDAVNAGGTIQVMLAAARAGARRVVLAGSSSVYGASPTMPRRESQRPDPRSPYAVSKLASEGYVHSLGELRGIETVVLRYFNIFGPDQDPDSDYAAVVPRFVTAALAHEAVTVYGDGRQTRDFTYIDNVIEANLRALDTPGISGLTCNIGCGGRYSLLDLLDAIAAVVGYPVKVRHEDRRPGDVMDSQADIELARRQLGYEVAVPFSDGVRRTVGWYAEQAGAGLDQAVVGGRRRTPGS